MLEIVFFVFRFVISFGKLVYLFIESKYKSSLGINSKAALLLLFPHIRKLAPLIPGFCKQLVIYAHAGQCSQ